MNLTQLRYFVAIADSGLNVSLAARRLYATQSGVSKQLKQLEQELGCELFARKGRSLRSLTPAGLQVLAHARRVVAEVAALRTLTGALLGRSDTDATAEAGGADTGLEGPYE